MQTSESDAKFDKESSGSSLEGSMPRGVFVACWGVFAVILALMTWRWREAVIDDAYISFRYAFNLAHGQGLVFNPGERVEGFSNPTWTLLASLFIALGVEPVAPAQVLAYLSSLGLLVVTYRFGRRHLAHAPLLALVAPTLLMANQNLSMWSAHGLETTLFAFLVMASFEALAVEGIASESAEGSQQGPDAKAALRWGLVAMGAAVWTRPEGIFFVALVGAYRLLRQASARGLRRAVTMELPVWVGLLVPVLSLTVLRRAYYGEWLPNTYYAKAAAGAGTFQAGVDYLTRFVMETGVFGILLILLLPSALRATKGVRGALWVAVLGGIWTALRVGGDAFAGARLMLPVLAPLYLLVQDSVAAAVTRRPVIRYSALLVAVALGAGTPLATGPALTRQAELATSMTRNRTYAGRLLKAISPENTLLSLNTAGALPYYAERAAIDHYGLTDAHIARREVPLERQGGTGHEKGDGAYVLSREPDLILLRNVWLGDVRIEDYGLLLGTSEHEINANPLFASRYHPVDLALREDLFFGFYAHERVDVEALKEAFSKLDLKSLGPVEALTSERGQDRLLFAQAAALRKEGRIAEARRLLEASLTLYYGAADVHLMMGACLMDLGYYEKATIHFADAARIEPKNVDARLGGALAWLKLERDDVALVLYQEATTLEPSRFEAQINAASLLLKARKPAEALPYLEAAASLAPGDYETLAKLGATAALLGRLEQARDALHKAEKLAPTTEQVVGLKRYLEGLEAAAKNGETIPSPAP